MSIKTNLLHADSKVGMTLHDSCHSNVGWAVSKTTDELVSDGELTSSDFDIDLGAFTNIR